MLVYSTTETKFFMSWMIISSLVALMIISMIDEEYNVTVTGDDMKKQVTIGDLYNLVSSRL